MPQLAKGGKFIFGLSGVSVKGTVAIPPQAMDEYKFREGDYIILMSGSRRSGGFGLTKRSIIEKSAIAGTVKDLPGLFSYRIPEAEVVSGRGRLFCWTTIKTGGCIEVPPETLSRYGVKAGDRLAVGRGSYLSIAFIARGPILHECRKHPELQVFEVPGK